MGVSSVKKPTFSVDQIVPASKVARNFKDVRRRARDMPQFITENNRIDSVIMDYATYEAMEMELEILREANWEYKIADRVKQADEHSEERYSIDQVLNTQEYESYRRIDPDSIADEDLFEDE